MLLAAAVVACAGTAAAAGSTSTASTTTASTVAAAATVTHLAGADRCATAAAVARASLPSGPDSGMDVAVARGDAFPDALSAVNLIGSTYDGFAAGALLLSECDQLPAESAAVVDDANFTRGYVMGTADVMGEAVLTRVAAAPGSGDVARVGGADRYLTNASSYHRAYNAEADQPASVDGRRTAFLVSGNSYADAISAGPVSSRERVPLLLSDPATLPASTREILTQYGLGITQVLVVGGPQAISEEVVGQLQAIGMSVRRVAGADRQATSVAMHDFAHEEFGWSPQHITLARGDDFADAIAGATHAGCRESSIVLTGSPTALGGAARTFFSTHADGIHDITVLGGTTAVSNAVVAEAVNAS